MISNVGMVLRNIYSKKYLVNYKVWKVSGTGAWQWLLPVCKWHR